MRPKKTFFVMIALLMMSLIVVSQGAIAQDETTSSGTSENTCDITSALESACGEMGDGEICYGAGTIAHTGNDEIDFAAAGDVMNLAGIETVSSDGQDGALTMKVPSGEGIISMALIGEGEITNLVSTDTTDLATLNIQNRQAEAVNLREGPGIDFPIAGVFAYQAEAIVDGRTEDQKWLRAQTDSGVVWIFSNLVRILDEGGQFTDLAVVESLYNEPMLSIRLATSAEARDCGQAGLLIDYNGESPARMSINDVNFIFDSVTMQIQSQPNENMTVNVINGDVELRFAGLRTSVLRGNSTQVALGGDTGLEAVAQPEVERNFAFDSIAAAPMGLFSTDDNMCLAGVDAETSLLYLPREDATSVLTMTDEEHYRITGQTQIDGEAEPWLRVRSASSVQGWIPQSDIMTAGLCGALPEIDSETVFTVVTPGSFVPVGTSIWTANSGNDQVAGECIYPPLAICNHLVAISANPDGSLSWRGQEPEPYRMAKVTENEYSYGGRNKLGNASVSLYLRFNSSTSWGLTMTQVFDNDPNCTHTFNYAAVPR
ncbi:MAG: hypothetical protein ACPG7F_07050 [Aggregatilineales bacterium]